MIEKTKFLVQQIALFVIGSLVLIYTIIVLMHASSSYNIGVKSIFTTDIIGQPRSEHQIDGPDGLRSRDKIVEIGGLEVNTWAELLQVPTELVRNPQNDPRLVAAQKVDPTTGQLFVLVKFHRHGEVKPRATWRELRRTQLDEIVPSLLWLLLKGALFVIGAIVYWKRPQDDAALRFYILCIFTLGAYIGGYLWTYIATEPILMVIFMVCGVFLPVTSLHFYLVFPRKKRWLELYPRRALLAIYGLPLCNLAVLLGFYVHIRWIAADAEFLLREVFPWVIYSVFATAMIWHVCSMAALVHSARTVQDPMELKQVRCVLFGIMLSMIPIGYSLYIVLAVPDAFAEGAVTWPMFIASAIVTLGFAIAMTRYRLMELDTIINSGLGYFFVSFLAGLMYYAIVFIGTLFYNRFVTSPTLPAALTVSTFALLFVIALDLARGRIKKALDRRFSRDKSQLDQTLRQLSEAVSQLVDPPVLAQRMLTTIADALGTSRGAVFLRRVESPNYTLSATRGDPPSLHELPANVPLVEALNNGLGLETASAAEGRGTSAQQQLHLLGAEIAQPLMHDNILLAILILGPKETPYRSEDWTLLSAFAQVTVVALESAAQHRTIDELHRDLQAKVDKIAEQQRRIMTLQTQLTRQASAEKVVHRIEPTDTTATDPADGGAKIAGIVGSSAVVGQLLSVVRKVAATDAVVLLRGESGTGKELLARAVHENSPRAGNPYVKVHCAALTPSLLESELFGHVKGAFTGAHRDKIGRFETASGGTLFLDEIGDITLDVQIKLLRVLQEKAFERVGSSETVQIDVRIIAATHQDLENLIRLGRFREDLFYRLNVFPVQVPPLRDRREDIPELVLHFVKQAALRCRKKILNIEDDALAALRAYGWPGNIRELENVIERAAVIADGDTLGVRDFPPEIFHTLDAQTHELDADVNEPAIPPSPFRTEREQFEREQLVRALGSANGNKSEAARILGVARSTLVSRMKKLGIA